MPRFRIAKGSDNLKEDLFAILHGRGKHTGGLRQFLKSLDKIEDLAENWWVAIDPENSPSGALSAVYYRGTTYLRSIWNGSEKYEDQLETSKVLLDAWVKEKFKGVKIYQADLSMYSPIGRMIELAGFKKQKLLIAAYELDTDWAVFDLPDGYRMREPLIDELGDIYDLLVAPDLDESSPIYVTRDQFMSFPSQLPQQAFESWVVVENDHGALVGFGASFLGQEEGDTLAILYGPHATESDVLKSIIAETITFWKGHNIDRMRILRTSEYYNSVIDAFSDQNIKMINSTVRYIMRKRR